MTVKKKKKTLQMWLNPTYFEYALKYHDGVSKYLTTIVGWLKNSTWM